MLGCLGSYIDLAERGVEAGVLPPNCAQPFLFVRSDITVASVSSLIEDDVANSLAKSGRDIAGEINFAVTGDSYKSACDVAVPQDFTLARMRAHGSSARVESPVADSNEDARLRRRDYLQPHQRERGSHRQ